MKKPNYEDMFTLRSDGRYQGYWHEPSKDGKGKRHAICDRDPERLYQRIQEKENPQEAPLTFLDAADAWDKKHTERISNKTAEAYKAPLRRIKEQYAGEYAADITAQSIQAFLSDLGKQNFSRRTVQMHRDILNMIFNNAIVEGHLSFNPCSAVALPRNLSSKKRELPDDDAIESVKKGGSQPFGLFALVCLYGGLRRGEALALQYEDIDRDKKLIHITKAVEFIGNDPHIKSTKTKAGIRDVPLLDPLADALPDKEEGLIFARDDGDPLTKTQYRKRWEKYCAAIGCEITAHQLRHGYATILYEAGIPDKDAQELLGHSSITVTRDVYTHIRQSQKKATGKKLNRFVKKAKKKKSDGKSDGKKAT